MNWSYLRGRGTRQCKRPCTWPIWLLDVRDSLMSVHRPRCRLLCLCIRWVSEIPWPSSLLRWWPAKPKLSNIFSSAAQSTLSSSWLILPETKPQHSIKRRMRCESSWFLYIFFSLLNFYGSCHWSHWQHTTDSEWRILFSFIHIECTEFCQKKNDICDDRHYQQISKICLYKNSIIIRLTKESVFYLAHLSKWNDKKWYETNKRVATIFTAIIRLSLSHCMCYSRR